MKKCEKKLLELIRFNCLKRGDFILASGAKSDYFIDLKTISVSSQGAALIGQALYKHTKDLSFESVGGMQAGAIPLVTAVVMCYHRHSKYREGFWVRSEVKDHGTQQKIEGIVRKNSPVIVVEDVCTTGQSALKVVAAVQECGATVKRVVVLVDRQQGGRELFEKAGIEFCSVFTIKQVLEEEDTKKTTAD